MKKIVIAAFILTLGLWPNFSFAEDSAATLDFGKPYAFATAPQQKNGAVFLQITNHLQIDERLVAVASDVAETVELHSMDMNPEGIMTMRKAEEGIAIPAGKTFVLEPSGNHIMLLGLKSPLVADADFNITLVFEKSGEMILPVRVVPPGQAPQ